MYKVEYQSLLKTVSLQLQRNYLKIKVYYNWKKKNKMYTFKLLVKIKATENLINSIKDKKGEYIYFKS